MTRRVLIYSLVWLFATYAAVADTLVVAGQAVRLRSPFIMEGGDILAPLSLGFRFLGVTAKGDDTTMTITTAVGSTLALESGSATAHLDGAPLKLPAAPRVEDDTLYMPVKRLGPLLGADVGYDPATSTLTVTPRMTIRWESWPEGVAVLVGSSGALQCTSGRAENPPRLYLDLRHVSLGLEDQYLPVNTGIVSRLHAFEQPPGTAALQASSGAIPDAVRLVIELSDGAGAQMTTSVTQGGHLLTALVHKELAPYNPEALQKERLLSATIAPAPEGREAVTITASGPVDAKATYDAKKRRVIVSLSNVYNTLTPADFHVPDGSLIATLESAGSLTETGAAVIITLKKDGGYQMRKTANGVCVVVGKFGFDGLRVTIDPGHGGFDSGAIGTQGTQEKDMTLDMGLHVRDLLEAEGATVLMTRDDDTFVALEDRPAMANKWGADVYVSIHCNSSDTHNEGIGVNTYYTTDQSKRLADTMQAAVVDGTGLDDSGVHTCQFMVTRKSTMPAILIEMGFLSNDHDENLLRTAEFRERAAEAIVEGLRRYVAGGQ